MVTGRDPSGGNVRLTIDPAVQKAAYDLMTQKGYTGAVVAMEPKTGRILAMVVDAVVRPEQAGFAHVEGADRRLERATTRTRTSPMLNRAISETYPPGSTIKLVTAAAALEDGKGPDTPVNPAPNTKLPGTSATLENYAGETCPGRHVQGRARALLQHARSRSSPASSARTR